MYKPFVLLCFFHSFYFVCVFFNVSLCEHNAKNVIKKPLTIHALQIFSDKSHCLLL